SPSTVYAVSTEGNSTFAISRLPPFGLCPGVPQLLASADALLCRQTFEHQLAGRDRVRQVAALGEPDVTDQVEHAGHDAEALDADFRPFVTRNLERAALIEPRDDAAQVGSAGPFLEHPPSGAAYQLSRDGIAALELTLVFQLELPSDGRGG